MTVKQARHHRFRRCLIWTFWLSLVFTVGFTWYYLERRIPDRVSVVVQEQEEFDFQLPFGVTLLSESAVSYTHLTLPTKRIV